MKTGTEIRCVCMCVCVAPLLRGTRVRGVKFQCVWGAGEACEEAKDCHHRGEEMEQTDARGCFLLYSSSY